MRKKIENVLLGVVALVLAVAIAYPLWADYTIPQPGSSLTGLAFSCSAKVCPAQVLVSSGGTEYNTSTPFPMNVYNNGTIVVADPCQVNAKSYANFSNSAIGTLITGTSAKKTYICSLQIVTSAAANVSLVEGTGSTCVTGSPAAVFLNSGTTAANGASFAANSGISIGSGGYTVAAATGTNADNVCLLFTTTNSPTVVASVGYVQQ